MKAEAKLATAVTLAITLAGGCSPATTDAGPDTTAVGGERPLTDPLRYAALGAITLKVNALTAATVDGRRQELINYLQSRPEIEDAGANDDGSVWAVFNDGRPIAIIAEQPEVASSSASEHRDQMSVAFSGGPALLPAGVQARILLGGGKSPSQTVNSELQNMLQARNYTIASGSGDATIDALKSVQGDAVFYIRGHGTTARLKNRSSSYTLLTATPATLQNDAQYKEDLDSLRIGYAAYVNSQFLPAPGRPLVTWYYGITSKFVSKYFSFVKNSFVYVATNSSFDPQFLQAFLDAGAGVYWGWTFSMTDGADNLTTRYLFDRLLGLNQFQPESPIQRPFDYESVWQDMTGSLVGITPNGSHLDHVAGPNGPSGLLAPSIKYMNVDESTGTLYLSGEFGDEKPEVRINGAPQRVSSWNESQIQVALPMSGSSSAGNVVVLSRNRPSNTRVLSEWRLLFTIRFIEGRGTLKWEGPSRVHIRADVGSYRDDAGQNPQYRIVPFTLVADSDGEITASGFDGNNMEWLGTAKITNRIADPNGRNQMDVVGEIETERPAMRMFFAVSAIDGMFARIPSPPSFMDVPLAYVWVYSDDQLVTPPHLPAMRLALNTDFAILGDVRYESQTTPTAELFWPTTDAKYARPDTTARFTGSATSSRNGYWPLSKATETFAGSPTRTKRKSFR